MGLNGVSAAADAHHREASWGRRLLITMALNLIIPIIQIVGGVISGSMALISDALHNLSDFTSALISYLALRMGRRGPTFSQTFGYKRLEVFAAALNAILLCGVGIFIFVESAKRFLHPQPVTSTIVIWVALVGFVANLASTVLLHAGAQENLNIRGVFLHMLSDALMSLAVFFLGIVWLFKPWYRLDPIASWVIMAIIIYGAWKILRDTFVILMNATPSGIDLTAIQREIEAVEGITAIHHLHIWNMSAEEIALAAHVIVPDQMLSKVDELAVEVSELLLCRFNIVHPVLQFETKAYESKELLCTYYNKKRKGRDEHDH
ncbi:MAG: cation diffusion facilitator family transporter [Smithellaceae bacterium]|nr:cation diffusion facilitator family transporter [Smithellaceae bacterium]